MKHSKLELKIPPLALFLLCGLLMWAIAALTPGLTLTRMVRLAMTLPLLAAAAGVGWAAISQFRRSRTTVNPMKPESASRLVHGGIFRRSRNPMYLALLLVLLAWGAWLGNVFTLAAPVLFVLWMNRFQIHPEERALTEAFGPDYRDYQRQVRRWL
jgi:protein-S-isoprenylcysteine O-methyltransferase Ste14